MQWKISFWGNLKPDVNTCSHNSGLRKVLKHNLESESFSSFLFVAKIKK